MGRILAGVVAWVVVGALAVAALPTGGGPTGSGASTSQVGGGQVESVATSAPFYTPGKGYEIMVVIVSEMAGEGIDGRLQLFIVPDGDPLGGGGEQEGAPVVVEERLVMIPADPTMPARTTEVFPGSLPPEPWLYYAVARWQDAGSPNYEDPVSVRFGVRPDVPGVPDSILTFREVSVDVSQIVAALQPPGPPTVETDCFDVFFPPGLSHANENARRGREAVREHNPNAVVDQGRCTAATSSPLGRVTLPLGAYEVMADLQPANLLADDSAQEADAVFYHGFVTNARGDPVGRARLTLAAGMLHAMIREPAGGETFLEALAEYIPSVAPDRYIAYHSDALRAPVEIHEKGKQEVLAPPPSSGAGSSHLTTSDLYRVLRLKVWKDSTSFSAMHHVNDMAEIYETDLKIKIEASYQGTVNSNGYNANTCGGDPSFLWSFRRDPAASTSGSDARILFTNNPGYNYGSTLGCGGGSGSASTRAAWVLHTATSYQIQQVAAQEIGHALGANHDCVSTVGHFHAMIDLGWGFAGWIHQHQTVMCGTYPGDDASAKVFSAFSIGEITPDAHNLPKCMHYWSGSSAVPDGLTLQEFWLRHDCSIPLANGQYRAGFTVVNTAGADLDFHHFHMAFDPDLDSITRVRHSDAFTLPDGWWAAYVSGTATFPGPTILGQTLWTGGEVWPCYRLDDGHAHAHYCPNEWNGVDFEL